MARKSTAEAKIKVKAETQKLDKYQGQLSLWLLVLSPEDLEFPPWQPKLNSNISKSYAWKTFFTKFLDENSGDNFVSFGEVKIP